MPLLCHKKKIKKKIKKKQKTRYILDVMNSVSDICIFNSLLLWLVILF